jgi:hypothetical protein
MIDTLQNALRRVSNVINSRQKMVANFRPAKSLVTPIRYHTCVQLVSYRKNIIIITNGYAEASNWRIFNSDLDLHVLFVSNERS